MRNNSVRSIDFLIILVSLGIILAFIFSQPLLHAYKTFNQNHGLITSFIKFALLATFGEVLGQRIRNKDYHLKHFGIVPKMIIWGIIGLSIKYAFMVFAIGTPQFLSFMGLQGANEIMSNDLSLLKATTALCISIGLNLIYAPLMMTFHKITDLHITKHHGHINSLIKPMKMTVLLKQINWDVQWNFVFKKTIPLFWIPAHTVTFLLPADYQVLFAAILSIALGIILATASLKGEKK